MRLANGMELDFSGRSALQHESEISEMLNVILAESEIRNVIEIGSFEGGTAHLWAQLVAKYGGTVYCVDVQFGPGNKATGGWENRCIPIYRGTKEDGRIIEIEGTSQDSEVIRRITELLNGELVDFLFIDGDHTYQCAQADLENYSPFVRDGGWIAFHDARNEAWGVSRFWKEIRQHYENWEFFIHEQPDEVRKTDRALSFTDGIGLIRWRSE